MISNELVIDRVLKVHKYDFNGKRVWTATQIRDPQLECGGEVVYATDAVGANIMGFDRSKTGSFAFSNALMHMGVLASQLGADKQVATSEDKKIVTCIELLTVSVASSNVTATLTHTPYEEVSGVPFKFLDKVDKKSLVTEKTFELGSTASTNFSVSGTTITLPTGAGFVDGDTIMVKYKWETETATVIENGAETFGEAGEFVVEALAYNPCDKATKLYINIIFPNGKEDNNLSITMTNELTHPVTINVMQEYCSDNKQLFRIEVVE